MTSNRQVSGTTALNGHRIGRHGVCSDVSLIRNAYQTSSMVTKKNTINVGKNNVR